MTDQPTNEALCHAFSESLSADDTLGFSSGERIELKRLRDLRTTWFGSRELDLRKAIDCYLSGELPYDPQFGERP